MSGASPARLTALVVLSECRRRGGRVRDVARASEAMAGLSAADRALATRLAVGATSAQAVLDDLLDARLRRPSSLEPRVRDALRLSAFELCYLETPAAVAASQGVELVRSVAPRAAGLANAVLRRVAREDAPRVAAALARCRSGDFDENDLSLASGLPAWLVSRVLSDRGRAFARDLCLAQGEPAPVFVATNALRHAPAELEARLGKLAMGPVAVEGLPGAFLLVSPAPLASSGLVGQVDLVVADVSAQVVCRLAAPYEPCEMLEVGQGRGTKSVLLTAAADAVRPTHVTGVDSVAYKVGVSSRRMAEAGLVDAVTCVCLDACDLAGEGLPPALDRAFGAVLVDAPCSGSGTTRRHPEIPASLGAADVSQLADLQLRILSAVAARVAPGGTVAYSTCSVLREEDEDVVAAFLAGEAGRAFEVVPVGEASACVVNPQLGARVRASQTPEGFLLTAPARGLGDGHFCALLARRG